MASGGMESVPPNQSIYINNLNEKIKRPELKKALYAVFSQFGNVIQLVAHTSFKLRGQAWVIFDSIESATNALRQMQGFPFFEKPMRIQFAKSKSDVVAKRDGTFVPREKRKRDEPQPASEHHASVVVPIPPPKVYNAAPNHILFAEGLPPSTTKEVLTPLFEQFDGFSEVRIIPGNKGMAFVEFGTEAQSTVALQSLNGFQISKENRMTLSYAKK